MVRCWVTIVLRLQPHLSYIRNREPGNSVRLIASPYVRPLSISGRSYSPVNHRQTVVVFLLGDKGLTGHPPVNMLAPRNVPEQNRVARQRSRGWH